MGDLVEHVGECDELSPESLQRRGQALDELADAVRVEHVGVDVADHVAKAAVWIELGGQLLGDDGGQNIGQIDGHLPQQLLMPGGTRRH